MSQRRVAALVLLSALVALPAGLAPLAAAHCPSTSGGIFGLVRTCGYNDEVEAVLATTNPQTKDDIVFVVVKDKSFHPPVITIKSGTTVAFVYADADTSETHAPRGSGRCLNGVDPLVQPEACVPTTLSWVCFDQFTDDGAIPMQAMGQTYPVTLKYTSPSGPVQKSRGFLSGSAVGDLTGAQEFRLCPSSSGYYSAAQAVLPYHCLNHGAQNSPDKMRGTIIVQA